MREQDERPASVSAVGGPVGAEREALLDAAESVLGCRPATGGLLEPLPRSFVLGTGVLNAVVGLTLWVVRRRTERVWPPLLLWCVSDAKLSIFAVTRTPTMALALGERIAAGDATRVEFKRLSLDWVARIRSDEIGTLRFRPYASVEDSKRLRQELATFS